MGFGEQEKHQEGSTQEKETEERRCTQKCVEDAGEEEC